MDNVRAVGDRIEALVAELGTHGDPAVRERARDLVQLLMQFYGAGLERIVRVAGESGGSALVALLAEDPLVASLLLLHDLHPVDTRTRVLDALAQVRPSLATHGGDVELVGIEDGFARLRLVGSSHGCGSSTALLREAVEQAVREAAPDLRGLEVDGAAAAPESPLIQIQVPGRKAI